MFENSLGGVGNKLKNGDEIAGLIVDVTNNPARGGLNATVKMTTSDYVYVPLASITKFSF